MVRVMEMNQEGDKAPKSQQEKDACYIRDLKVYGREQRE